MNRCEICGSPNQGLGPFCESCLAYDPDQVFVSHRDDWTENVSVSSGNAATSSSTPGSSNLCSPSGGVLVRRRSTENVDRRDLSSHESMPSTPYARLMTVNLRPSQQIQMLSDFLNSHFPTAEARASLASRASYLVALPDMDVSANPLLRAAIDTLCFAHIGSKTGDRRLVQESQTSYGKVLTALIRATSAPPSQMQFIDPKAVITSVMLMALYDDSVPARFQRLEDWGTHYWGAQQLLRAYGPSVLNMSEPLEKLIFINLRMPSFFVGVARRKAVVMGEPRWLAVAESNAELRGANLTGFYRIAMQIPGLLERCDCVLDASISPTSAESVIREIAAIRLGLQDWYESRLSCRNGVSPQTPVLFNVLDEADAFDMDIEEHRVIALSDTFKSMFRWPVPGTLVKNHTYLLMMNLLLDCTLLRIFHFRPTVLTTMESRIAWDNTCRSAYDNAANLCRSVYHYSRIPGLPYVDFTNFIVEMAQNFFEEIDAPKEIKWCRNLRDALHQRRERIKRTIQARTLCRMAESGPGFAAAMHFRRTSLVPR